MNAEELRIDFSERPYIVICEVMQPATLARVHCLPERNPLDLSTEEGTRLKGAGTIGRAQRGLNDGKGYGWGCVESQAVNREP